MRIIIITNTDKTMGKLRFTAKCSDLCSCVYENDKGEIVAESDSYVPSGINIGDAYGDYVEMEIDMHTGQILNWKPVSEKKIIEAIKKA